MTKAEEALGNGQGMTFPGIIPTSRRKRPGPSSPFVVKEGGLGVGQFARLDCHFIKHHCRVGIDKAHAVAEKERERTFRSNEKRAHKGQRLDRAIVELHTNCAPHFINEDPIEMPRPIEGVPGRQIYPCGLGAGGRKSASHYLPCQERRKWFHWARTWLQRLHFYRPGQAQRVRLRPQPSPKCTNRLPIR